MKDSFFYGGQAVIEGVMMRGRQALAIGVRRPDGSIVVHEQALVPWSQRSAILRRPLLRGVVALAEALIIGIRALNFSAAQATDGEEEPLSAKEMAVSLGLAIAMTVGLFVVLPAFLIRFIQDVISHNLVLNLVEGLIKVSLFALYILAIGQMPDIKRVFQYHGAEHKAINCYEAGLPLTVDNVARQSIVHTRCGTNFILIVLLMSVFLFSFFGRPPFVERVLIHLLLLPVVAGLSYEIIRHAAKDNAWALVRWIATPGLWMQRLTTRPPEREQLEVAIAALERVLVRDGAPMADVSAEAAYVR
ncbi:MAG: hypothetical protein BAA04_10975 [Firmicutes bacterium ZCTH02-B6]|nr:MAG: hypothetical protein BAA04_10975 [Firmicutes bacterium ZCTH02-B6]